MALFASQYVPERLLRVCVFVPPNYAIYVQCMCGGRSVLRNTLDMDMCNILRLSFSTHTLYCRSDYVYS